MMQKDETVALATVGQHQIVLEESVARHEGRVLQYYGDGSLSIFNSAVQAVACALDMQKTFGKEPKVPLRIGIHIGEILFSGDKLYGDGVNIASRIESLGMAGSVLLSDHVHDKIMNRPDMPTVSLGFFKVKNVEKPIEVFALKNDEIVVPKRNQIVADIEKGEPGNEKWWRKKIPVYPLLWMACILGVLLVIVSWLYFNQENSNTKTVRRFTITFPEEAPLSLVGGQRGSVSRSFCISPDGSRLVYVAWRESFTQLYMKSLVTTDTRPIPGTEGGSHPFFSPDGEWVGYFSNGILKKVHSDNDGVVDICTSDGFNGGTFILNNIVFSGDGGKLFKVDANGGEPEILKISGLYYPSAIPGTDEVLVQADSGIFSISIKTREMSSIMSAPVHFPMVVPTGHFLYTQPGKVFAFPYKKVDVQTRTPMPVIDFIRTETSGEPQLTVSSDGIAIHLPGYHNELSRFAWVDRQGKIEYLDLPVDQYGQFDLSPDGRYIAYSLTPSKPYLGLYDLINRQTRLIQIYGSEENIFPVWSPDGRWIVFNSLQNRIWRLAKINIEGAGETELLSEENVKATDSSGVASARRWEDIKAIYSWSSDGKYIFYNSHNEGMLQDNWMFQLKDSLHKPLISTPWNDRHPSISPDSRFLAYSSEISGRLEIFVQPFPPDGRRWQISFDGGADPIWSHKGDEMFFLGDYQFFSVKINSGNGFHYDQPKPVFSVPMHDISGKSISISPDGNRFLVLLSANEERIVREAIVTVNWFEELNRLVPIHD